MLNVENVRKAFGHATVLDGVDLTIKPGEVVSILGSSGSGKSTLIRCINGLEKLNGGRITVDEFDVSKPKELAEARKRSTCPVAVRRPWRPRRCLSGPAFRRSAPARRHLPGPCHATALSAS
jgi:ABC-type histidine transport system ATPase subunit